MSHKLIICSALVAFVILAPAVAAADVIDITNAVRSQGCGRKSVAHRPILSHRQLNEAARRLSQGDSLQEATSKSGYRARQSATIVFQHTNGDAGISRMLAQRFCRIVADPNLREIGVYQRGDRMWMVLAAPFSPPAADDAPAVVHRVRQLINDARTRGRRCGRKRFYATRPLQQAHTLDRAALAHAREMAAHSFLSHASRDGSMPDDRATRAGYVWSAVAENVAAGQPSAEEVVNTWLESPGHCANLMNPRYTETGIAFAVDKASDKGIYWAQLYATPK
jgi:uncharacterized protein YkwD